MAAPAYALTIARAAQILHENERYCGTLHSAWSLKTAASGSMGLTNKKYWPSQIAEWTVCGN
jgi:hypothetical protein